MLETSISDAYRLSCVRTGAMRNQSTIKDLPGPIAKGHSQGPSFAVEARPFWQTGQAGSANQKVKLALSWVMREPRLLVRVVVTRPKSVLFLLPLGFEKFA